MMEYRKGHTVRETSQRYGWSEKTVKKWWSRWDGTPSSLVNRSRRPKHSPRRTPEAVIRRIRRMMKKHSWREVLLGYQEMRERWGYTGSYGGFKRIVSKLKGAKPKRKVTKKGKAFPRAEYPGQRLQVDVKFVPGRCVTDGRKYYQFTAIDECTRWTMREMYEEHSSLSAKEFVVKLVATAPFPIRRVQTDNGAEFSNALLVVKAKHKTLFEEALEEMGIEYHRIRVATPQHNGKVERQHRTDEARFYSRLRMYSLVDGRKQLALYQRASNDHIKTCLGLRSPNAVLADYLAVM
jgi:transposase InsO family protein